MAAPCGPPLHGHTAPTAKNFEATASPSNPLSGSFARMDQVTAIPSVERPSDVPESSEAAPRADDAGGPLLGARASICLRQITKPSFARIDPGGLVAHSWERGHLARIDNRGPPAHSWSRTRRAGPGRPWCRARWGLRPPASFDPAARAAASPQGMPARDRIWRRVGVQALRSRTSCDKSADRARRRRSRRIRFTQSCPVSPRMRPSARPSLPAGAWTSTWMVSLRTHTAPMRRPTFVKLTRKLEN